MQSLTHRPSDRQTWHPQGGYRATPRTRDRTVTLAGRWRKRAQADRLHDLLRPTYPPPLDHSQARHQRRDRRLGRADLAWRAGPDPREPAAGAAGPACDRPEPVYRRAALVATVSAAAQPAPFLHDHDAGAECHR